MENQTDHRTSIQAFFRALENKRLEECEAVLRQLLALAQRQPEYLPWCEYFAGILANERDNDWAKAELIFQRLLQGQLALQLRGRVLIALGRTYEYQGRWAHAIKAYEQSLPIFAEVNQPVDQAKAWKQIAIACWRGFNQDDLGVAWLHTAETYCQQALHILETQAEIEWLRGSLFNVLGAIHMRLQQWEKSIAYYQQDLAVCQALDDRFGMGITQGNLGEVYQRLGPHQWIQAEQAYQQALKLIHEFNAPHAEMDIIANLASLYKAMGQSEQARTHYQQAIRLIEGLRANISAEEARTGFFTTVIAVYAKFVQLLVESNDIPMAFDFVERARSRSFIELLAGQTIRSPQRVPPALLTREQALRDELRTLYQSDDQTGNIAELEQALDATLQEIRLMDAEYADLRTVQPLNYQQVQDRLPTKAALISYFTTDQEIYAFVVTHQQVTGHLLPLKMKDLRRAFDDEHHLLRMNLGTDGCLHDPFVLGPLYDHLLKPLATRFLGLSVLYIVPHGLLHFVPFHALRYTTNAGEPRALLDDYQVIYAPSATVLLEYCQKPRNPAAQPLLAVGYNGDDLRHAEAEATAIATLVEGGVALIQAAATTQQIVEQAERFRWVHFACHAQFNAYTPLMSHLRLAAGPLYASDVLQHLRLQAELVTLGACETGRNKVLKGDELLGLVRAFIYAGTPSVLVSLWSVDELSTRILMERFYRELLGGQVKAEALRHAQRYLRDLTAAETIIILAGYGEAEPHALVQQLARLTHAPNSKTVAPETKIFAHPYFWAPFVLVGDQLEKNRIRDNDSEVC